MIKWSQICSICSFQFEVILLALGLFGIVIIFSAIIKDNLMLVLIGVVVELVVVLGLLLDPICRTLHLR